MPEITIRGAGIFGLSIAWACVLRGARVQVIDPKGPASGSSGGFVGALAPHVPENWNTKKAFQLDSLLMAEAFWSRVQEASDRPAGYVRTGRLQPVADATALDLARRRSETAVGVWQDNAVWRVERPLDTAWAPHSPTGWLIRDTLSAHLHPRQACSALVAALAQKDVPVLAEGKDAGAVVWATGVSGLDDLTRHHHRLVGNGVKGQAALLKHDARGAPQIFANTVHVVPHQDGTVAVGSTSERAFDDPTSTNMQLDTVIEKARAAVPALRDAPEVERWAGVRPRSRSRAPMLGPWPERPGHFIANGGFKIGFGMAPKVAEVMANLLLEGRNEIPEGFDVAASL